ncbi:uncharacterized protein LOC131630248 isoform X1 [Vicia villosa]|uniref:uncharacterized protein LOC131630248 isoform X1 n=1 Tax=Vicia villosa TaxID=3911 RepID=UPI00273AD66B|nr:uncharacterized protein LOC131630248 isoform X1 [Vicia villosa]
MISYTTRKPPASYPEICRRKASLMSICLRRRRKSYAQVSVVIPILKLKRATKTCCWLNIQLSSGGCTGNQTNRLRRRNHNWTNFLSINRFERKKNIQLAISAFAMLYSPD